MGYGLPGSLPSYIHYILSSVFLWLIKIVVVVVVNKLIAWLIDSGPWLCE